MQARVALAFATTASIITACSIAPPGDGSGRNYITQEQLAASNVVNLYQAIEKLRPQWLTTRGPTSLTDATPTEPSVHVDGNMAGGLEYLRQLNVTDVGVVRFWPAGEAAARFGMGHPRGVIEIRRR